MEAEEVVLMAMATPAAQAEVTAERSLGTLVVEELAFGEHNSWIQGHSSYPDGPRGGSGLFGGNGAEGSSAGPSVTIDLAMQEVLGSWLFLSCSNAGWSQ
jgi:hypothetical protein